MTAPDLHDGEALRKEAASWLDRIEAAYEREKVWRDDAQKARQAYSGEGEKTEGGTFEPGTVYDFNILHANVETIVPAVINSPPTPDIRRRFGSADPVARDLAEMLERAMRVQVDDGRLQSELEKVAQDGFLAGRGLIRVRFKSDFGNGETTAGELEADAKAARTDEAAEPAVQTQQNERICFEAISWRDAAHGPAVRWDDVPWWSFRHVMQSEDLDGFADQAIIDAQREGTDTEEDEDRTVWEVWDRRTKTVVFIAEKDKRIIWRVPDPLGLSSFYPIATPVQPIELTGRLMPVNPFSIYRRLADELDTTTKRIRVILKQLKVKGAYSGDPAAFQQLLEADDNEFVPLPDTEALAARGGLEQAIVFWPVEKLIIVLKELFAQREATKQAIYEITGISDIVRGASRSGETATAQQIKTQWGSLRIQKFQRMMERAARDVFLMMAEIIPAKFSAATLQQMTDIQIEPTDAEQQPVPMPPAPQMQTGAQPDPQMAEQYQQAAAQAQEAEQKRQARLQHLMQLQALMAQPMASYFRVDVETDSTVRADLTRQKEEATGFMQAASQYFAAVAPLVQQGALPMNVAVEIFGSFSRLFNLGKSVEDALEELIEKASEAAGQPAPPDPAAEAAKAEMQMKAEAQQAELAAKQQDGAIKVQQAEDDRVVKGVELEIKQTDLQMKRLDLVMKQQEAFAPPAQARLAPSGGFGRG